MFDFKKKTVSFDLHGTIDNDIPFFKEMMSLLLEKGWKVYIITGMEKHRALKEVEPYDIEYTDLLSVTDYHKEIGTKITFDEKGNPWIDEILWNETKAEMCRQIGSIVHVDDQNVYEKAFYKEGRRPDTIFLLYIADVEATKTHIETIIRTMTIIVEYREKGSDTHD
jgi:hypothetical protein